jgi:hypothetical protein
MQRRSRENLQRKPPWRLNTMHKRRPQETILGDDLGKLCREDLIKKTLGD